MKILQISDIHYRGLARHDEYRTIFTKLFAKAKEIQPDIILGTGDFFHTKTQGLTPEVVDQLAWMFRSLADIAPLHLILGNHDGNLANDSRQDAISPIVDAMNHPKIFLYKRSGNYPLNQQVPSIAFSKSYDCEEVLEEKSFAIFNVFSCFDKEGWINVKPVEGMINIALYHGSITGCETDSEWMMPHGEEALSFFNGYDFAMLGDIHKQQFLAKRPCVSNVKGQTKPWIGYPGSLIQQNYGEDEQKGFLVWDIRAKNDWDVDFYPIVNDTPFLSIPWMGSVHSTIQTVEDIRGDLAFPKGARIRVLSNQNISQLECRQLYHEIRINRECAEVVFKFDVAKTSNQAIQTGTVLAHKTSLRNDVATLVALYLEYVHVHMGKLGLSQDQLEEGGKYIEKFLKKFNEQQDEETTRDVLWNVNQIEFSNLFRFGEGNKINFDKLSGIVGIFGANRSGKSSVVSALSYGLFNTTEREVGRAVGHYINRNKKTAKCKVHFTSNGTKYAVDRAIAIKEAKKGQEPDGSLATTTNLLLNRVDSNGVLVPFGNENDVTRPDTDKVIRGLIGNPQDFRLTSYASQGDINRFIEQGATQRKAILNRFLDLDIFEKLFKFANDERTFLNAKTSKFSLVTADTAINKASTNLSFYQTEEKELNHDILDLKASISNLRDYLAANNIQNNGFDIKAKRAKLESEIEVLMKKKVGLLSSTERKKDEQLKQEVCLAQMQTDIQNINIDELNNIKTRLIALKTEYQQLKVNQDKELVTLDAQKKSIKKLETVPCGDAYLGCRFIKDSHEDKGKLPFQQMKVENLSKEVTELDAKIKELAHVEVDKKIAKYNELVSALTTTEKTIIVLRGDIKALNVESDSIAQLIDSKVKELASPELQIVEETDQALELAKTKKEILGLENTLSTLETKRNKALMEIGRLTGSLESLKQEKEECVQILAQLQILDSVVDAFSKNGIPAMVLKTQLPAINVELDKILSNVVDFKLSLETEVSSNSLEIYIEDGNSKRVIELASGMEKMIASLAIRVALINLSSLPKANMLIIDEGFGVLDDESIVKCLQLLTSLKDYFRLILVISHIPQVKEVADKMIEVVNLGSESKIEV